MKIRKIVSLTALLLFILVVLNSVALYIAPHGRVARWVDWRFLGLSSTEWANQHIIVGLLFLIALLLHIYYNWTPIVTYLKNKTRKIKVFTWNFNIALALTVLFTVGAYMEAAPFSWVLDFSESIKNGIARKQGDPPFGRAEDTTLNAFVDRMEWNLAESRARLEQAGIKIGGPSRTLLEIARQNSMSPQRLYEMMRPDEKPLKTAAVLPNEPPQGFGRLSLSDVCKKYALDLDTVLAAFEGQGLTAAPVDTIKYIAEQHDLSPAEVFGIFKGDADRVGKNLPLR